MKELSLPPYTAQGEVRRGAIRENKMSNITPEKMRFWSPDVRELDPYVPGEQPKIQNILKLNTNENPYPPSPNIVAAVQAVLENSADALRLYPDPDATALKQAIAKQQNVDVENVFVGNGSDEVLAHIFKAFFVQEKPILYPDITYSFYPVYSQFFGIAEKTKILPLNDDFEIEVNDYKQLQKGTIKIGIPSMIGAYLFPKIFSGFQKKFAHLDIYLYEKGSMSIRESLERDELDFGIVIISNASPSLQLLPMSTNQVIACVPEDSPLAQ